MNYGPRDITITCFPVEKAHNVFLYMTNRQKHTVELEINFEPQKKVFKVINFSL